MTSAIVFVYPKKRCDRVIRFQEWFNTVLIHDNPVYCASIKHHAPCVVHCVDCPMIVGCFGKEWPAFFVTMQSTEVPRMGS